MRGTRYAAPAPVNVSHLDGCGALTTGRPVLPVLAGLQCSSNISTAGAAPRSWQWQQQAAAAAAATSPAVRPRACAGGCEALAWRGATLEVATRGAVPSVRLQSCFATGMWLHSTWQDLGVWRTPPLGGKGPARHTRQALECVSVWCVTPVLGHTWLFTPLNCAGLAEHHHVACSLCASVHASSVHHTGTPSSVSGRLHTLRLLPHMLLHVRCTHAALAAMPAGVGGVRVGWRRAGTRWGDCSSGEGWCLEQCWHLFCCGGTLRQGQGWGSRARVWGRLCSCMHVMPHADEEQAYWRVLCRWGR